MAGHFLVFAVLAALVVACVRTRTARLALMGSLLALAVGIEIAQHLLYTFQIETLDIGVDAVGILCGAAPLLTNRLPDTPTSSG